VGVGAGRLSRACGEGGGSVYEVNGKVERHIRERLPAPSFRHLAAAGAPGTPRISPVRADLEGECAMATRQSDA